MSDWDDYDARMAGWDSADQRDEVLHLIEEGRLNEAEDILTDVIAERGMEGDQQSIQAIIDDIWQTALDYEAIDPDFDAREWIHEIVSPTTGE